MPANAHTQRVTLLLVAVSSALVQVALDNRESGAGVALLAVSLVAACGLGYWVRRSRVTAWTVGAVAGLLALALLPLAWDAAARTWFWIGAPYEVQLAYVLRNAMLGLAVAPRLPRATRLAVLVSFFLTIFGYLWSSGPVAVGLLIVYGLLGTWWLLAAYWDGLGGRFADASETAIPLRPAVGAIVALGLTGVLLTPLVARSPVTTALAGFFPSSGGTGDTDPFANGGVGDGDQMVAAKDQASSFGPIDSELFLESQMPSLYDAFNEFSDAPPRKQKRARRAIPLAASQMQVNHQKTGTTQQASREFSTVRQKAPRRRNADDRLSASLLLVKGRTPLHLALETFDEWDGRSLIATGEATPVRTTLREPDAAGQRWLDLKVVPPMSVFTAFERTQVRVVNLKTDRVPTPAGTTSVTIDGLHAKSMFRFAEDGSLAMDVDYVPQLTIFDVRSALRDRAATVGVTRTTPPGDAGRIGELAAAWTEGVPAGWPQVAAIVDRLRSEYRHDDDAMVPADAEDAAEHFLLESKRGPDYLFAASTAVMLRSLGYDTRVRGGFYADPQRHNRKSRLTPVLTEDAHFWVEVRTTGGHRIAEDGQTLPGVWVTLEPTPGYNVLYAPESLLAWGRRMALAGLAALAAHPVAVSLACLGVALVFASRRYLIDGVLIGWWSIRSRTAGAGGLPRLTLRLLEWRAWAHRRARPAGATLGRWDALSAQDDFVELASWALYGADSAAPFTGPGARAVCGKAIRVRFAPRVKQTPAPAQPARRNDAEGHRWTP